MHAHSPAGRWSGADGEDRALSTDTFNTQPLDEFWEAHQINESNDHTNVASIDSPSYYEAKQRLSQPSHNGHIPKRNRAVSTASALAPPGQSLSPHHPALSLPRFLDTFGPLIFPLYKAALLRRRVMLVGYAPIELACNYGKAPTFLHFIR